MLDEIRLSGANRVKVAITDLDGILRGKFVSKEEITSIAAIPGMETLRAMFAQVINSPRQRFAVALSEVAKKKS